MQVDPTQQQVNNSLNINGNDPASPTSAAAGLWQGSYTIGDKTYSATGIINSSGEARFTLSTGVNFIGTVSTQNSKISGAFSVYDPDGIINGTSSLSGSFSPRGNMTATYTAPGGSSSTYNGYLDVSYNTIYVNPAALPLLVGTWSNTFGLSFTIGEGKFTGSDNQDGCYYSGNISVPSSADNIYELTVAISGCNKAGNYNGLGFINGTSFTYFISIPDQAYSETLAQQ